MKVALAVAAGEDGEHLRRQQRPGGTLEEPGDHENVDGRKLRDGSRRRRRRMVRAARQVRGGAAGADGDRQDDNACPIHTLHFPTNAATLTPP